MNKVFLLSLLIRRAKEEAGSVLQLANLIEDATKHIGKKGAISRRTLKKLAEEPEKVSLRYWQLVALDVFLSARGEGLDRNPLFQKPGILDCLIETPRVAFLLGSTPRESEHRNDLSRWDTRSMAGLLHEICLRSSGLYGGRRGVEFEIEDVLLGFPTSLEKLEAQPWHRLLHDKNCSVICVGSSRANHASELLLAQMFHLKPFEKQETGGVQPPFAFIWPDTEPGESGRSPRTPPLKRNPRGFQSRFALRAEDIARDEPELAKLIRQGKAYAFRWGDRIYPVVPDEKKPFKMYAVIAAQRRRGSQTHVVIAGISGPVTHAAATKVSEFMTALPNTPGEESAVIYVPVEALISAKKEKGQRGDYRKVESCRFFGDPQEWKPPPSVTSDG